jgi:hypothetical protein
MSLRPIPEELHVPDEEAEEEPAEAPVENNGIEPRHHTRHPRGIGFRRRNGRGGGSGKGGFGKPRTSRRDDTTRDYRGPRED